MGTYVTKISKTRCRSGFTLIEVLVVVLVVAILMGVVVASFSGVDREQSLRGLVERLALRIELARDRALQANREWGMFIDRDGVRFAEFDEVNGEWVDRADRPFSNEPFDLALAFDLDVEEYQLATQQSDDEEHGVPDVVLFSSGEITPFTLTLRPEQWETQPWQLASDGFTITEISRGES